MGCSFPAPGSARARGVQQKPPMRPVTIRDGEKVKEGATGGQRWRHFRGSGVITSYILLSRRVGNRLPPHHFPGRILLLLLSHFFLFLLSYFLFLLLSSSSFFFFFFFFSLWHTSASIQTEIHIQSAGSQLRSAFYLGGFTGGRGEEVGREVGEG